MFAATHLLKFNWKALGRIKLSPKNINLKRKKNVYPVEKIVSILYHPVYSKGLHQIYKWVAQDKMTVKTTLMSQFRSKRRLRAISAKVRNQISKSTSKCKIKQRSRWSAKIDRSGTSAELLHCTTTKLKNETWARHSPSRMSWRRARWSVTKSIVSTVRSQRSLEKTKPLLLESLQIKKDSNLLALMGLGQRNSSIIEPVTSSRSCWTKASLGELLAAWISHKSRLSRRFISRATLWMIKSITSSKVELGYFRCTGIWSPLQIK